MTDSDPSPKEPTRGPTPAASPARRRRWSWGRVRRGAGWLLLLYLGLTVILFVGQDWLIFPGHLSQGREWARITAPAGMERVSLSPGHGSRTTALYGPALDPDGVALAAPSRRATLLYFYGNGTCLCECSARIAFFRRLGLNVMIPEFVGYGDSAGRPGEEAFYRTADAARDWLIRSRGARPETILIGGESLGGAVAIDLAARVPSAGLVTVSTFTRMADVARRRFPIFPVEMLLRQRFESLEKIRHVRTDTLLIHGDADLSVPIEMRDRLAAAAGGRVTCLTIPGAGHENVFEVGGTQFGSAFRSFLAACGAGGP